MEKEFENFKRRFESIKKVVLKKIKPTLLEEKKTEKVVLEFESKIKKVLEEKKIKFFLGGSYAKNTWLSKSKDIDVFLKFDKKKYYEKDISKIAYEILKEHFKIEVLHGSRSYFNIKFKSLNFEIIPVYDIKSVKEKKNIMDLSPLHVEYVNSRLKNNDDVRILKYFLKQNNLYGAESYIEGFSGYVCELLIIYYNNIEELFYNVLEWKEETYIDIEGYYNNILEAKKVLKEKWNVLTIIDPVQEDRNASKSLNKKNYEEFKKIIKEFYKNTSLKFFKKKKKYFKKPYYIIKLYGIKEKKDVSASMLKKTAEYIIRSLKNKNFSIKSLYYYEEKNNVLILKIKVKKTIIDNVIEGPIIKYKKALEEFYKKHDKKNCFIKKDKVYCKEGKKSFEKEIKKIILEENIKKRTKKIVVEKK